RSRGKHGLPDADRCRTSASHVTAITGTWSWCPSQDRDDRHRRPHDTWCMLNAQNGVNTCVVAGQSDGRSTLLTQVTAQELSAARVAELGQGLGLDLADPLPGDTELPANLLQRPGMPVGQAETQLDDLLLTPGQGVKDVL